MTFDAFDVVVVPFPFSDRSAAKRRPALVVSSTAFNKAHEQRVLAMITTAAKTVWPSDVPISDLAAAGLRAASVVRFKLFTLDGGLILRGIGALSRRDAETVMKALTQYLAGVRRTI